MSYKKEKEYFCGYCKHNFKATAGFSGGDHDDLGRRSKCVSNTITCPKCGNHVKTWEEKAEREFIRASQKEE